MNMPVWVIDSVNPMSPGMTCTYAHSEFGLLITVTHTWLKVLSPMSHLLVLPTSPTYSLLNFFFLVCYIPVRMSITL